ncbi:MAG: HEAT repeat domain-containing protein [Deltaproteobacteria bacterium]|nr:HEAT repeat domain-containing protein [Deltaproteobacteria bacterium]
MDSLRAPAVGVRDGVVVGFCSKECAAALDSKPIPAPPAEKLQPTKTIKRPRTEPPHPPPKTPPKGVPITLPPTTESGPVIEVIRETTRPSKKREDDSAIQIADTGTVDDYVAPEGRGKAWLIGILIVVVVGGIAGAAYFLGAFGGRDAKSEPAPVQKPVVAPPPAPDAPPAVTGAVAVDKAKAVLAKNLKSDSPRVQRVAASALARTGDGDAIGQLVTQLAKETSDIAKLEIAYALARGGDKRGSDALVAALQAPRRDVRLEAARRLALLGDKRGVPVLTEYLDVSQLRLGAAEQLAYLADPAGLKALDAVRADPKATHDEQARATIALGIAGRRDVIPALEKLLTEKGNDAFAAAALADLHDAAARPLLEAELKRPTRRAEAARALRRLDPSLDPGPLLPPLLAALESAKDTEQVEAAEAVLLLAGPATWATHP